jgi:xanthine dehydrogenase YagR molybdenum-binding subunit
MIDAIRHGEVTSIEEETSTMLVGVKGLGDTGLVGVTAAIANAVFHATGTRLRDVPMTPDTSR